MNTEERIARDTKADERVRKSDHIFPNKGREITLLQRLYKKLGIEKGKHYLLVEWFTTNVHSTYARSEEIHEVHRRITNPHQDPIVDLSEDREILILRCLVFKCYQIEQENKQGAFPIKEAVQILENATEAEFSALNSRIAQTTGSRIPNGVKGLL